MLIVAKACYYNAKNKEPGGGGSGSQKAIESSIAWIRFGCVSDQ
jgi:hypothetical protein